MGTTMANKPMVMMTLTLMCTMMTMGFGFHHSAVNLRTSPFASCPTTTRIPSKICKSSKLHDSSSSSSSRILSMTRLNASARTADSMGLNPEQPPSDSSSDMESDKTTTELATATNTKRISIASFPMVLWRFSRPHTLIGSALAIPALHILAAPTFQAAFTKPVLASLIYSMIPSLLMNIYITGLNQITDVEIDKINKPTLPIAAGDLSRNMATVIVTLCLVVSLAMGVSNPVLGTEGLNVALWGSAILGTMYSLPPFRLKRFPLLAAFCIVVVRGTIINAGFFAHAQAAVFGNPTATVLGCILHDQKCRFTSIFYGIFGVVIALMKDVPDVKGDEIANIRSFSVRIGQKRVFQTMRRLISALFFVFGAGFIRASFTMTDSSSTTAILTKGCRAVVGVTSIVAGLLARKKATNVNAEDSAEVYKYYMYLWKLFYLSYFALPFAR